MLSPAQPTDKNAIQRNATPLTHRLHQPHQPHQPLPASQFRPMPTIPDEHWKLILEVTSEKACDLIHYIEDDVLNRPKDSAYNEVRYLLFTIRELAKRIKPLVTPSATLEPAPLVTWGGVCWRDQVPIWPSLGVARRRTRAARRVFLAWNVLA